MSEGLKKKNSLSNFFHFKKFFFMIWSYNYSTYLFLKRFQEKSAQTDFS